MGGGGACSETSKYEQSGCIFAGRQFSWSWVTDPLPPWLLGGGGGDAPGLVLVRVRTPDQITCHCKIKVGMRGPVFSKSEVMPTF